MSTGKERQHVGDYLRWKCDKCGDEIGDAEGWLTVDESAVGEAQDKQRAWDDAHPRDEMGHRGLTMREIMEQPDAVPWRAYHRRCDPKPEGGGYTIEVSRIRNFRHALGWSLHLMGSKEWVALTDWDEFIRTRTGAELG